MSTGARLTLLASIKLTIFAVVTIFLTLILASTIGSVGYSASHTYKADFSDATGLITGDDVRVAGVQVGKVTSIKVVGTKVAQVGFSVGSDVRVRSSATMQLRFRNLVGQRYVSLVQGSPSTGLLKDGATIPESQTQPALDLSLLLNGFKPLFQALDPQQVNQLSYEITQTLQGEGGTLDDLLTHTASLTNSLADRDVVIGRVINNLNTVLGTVSAKDAGLTDLIDSFQKLVTGLAQDRTAIGSSLQGIDDLTTSTASFLTPARPLIKQDVADLQSLVAQLDTTPAKQRIDKELTLLPKKLNTINRTATYGGWFNFYLCAADGTIYLPDGTKVAVSQLLQTSGTACGNG